MHSSSDDDPDDDNDSSSSWVHCYGSDSSDNDEDSQQAEEDRFDDDEDAQLTVEDHVDDHNSSAQHKATADRSCSDDDYNAQLIKHDTAEFVIISDDDDDISARSDNSDDIVFINTRSSRKVCCVHMLNTDCVDTTICESHLSAKCL